MNLIHFLKMLNFIAALSSAMVDAMLYVNRAFSFFIKFALRGSPFEWWGLSLLSNERYCPASYDTLISS
jgi:hypothetical protein